MGTLPMSCFDWHAGTAPVAPSLAILEGCFPREALLVAPNPVPYLPWNSTAKQGEVISVSQASGIRDSVFPLTPLVTVVEYVILSDPWILPAGDWRPPRRREPPKKTSRGWLWVLKRGPHHRGQGTSGALRQAPCRPPQRLSLHPPGHRLRKHNCAGLFQTHYLSSAPAS